jgi:hypothetical protein
MSDADAAGSQADADDLSQVEHGGLSGNGSPIGRTHSIGSSTGMYWYETKHFYLFGYQIWYEPLLILKVLWFTATILSKASP